MANFGSKVFFIKRLQTFFLFFHVFTFLTFLYFLSEYLLHICHQLHRNIHCVAKRPAVSLFITLNTCQRFSQFLANVYYKKFATRRCIINPPCLVCVTALPCKIFITNLVMFTPILIHSNCKIIILKPVYASK